MDHYRWWLVLHILGVVIFLGNIIVTFLWKAMADRSADAKLIAFSQRLVSLTDKVFTALGATLLVVSGYAYAAHLHLSTMTTPWIFWAQVCFYGSAALWAGFLVPIQHKQGKLAKTFESGGVIPEEYRCLSRRWNMIGTFATILPIIALCLMVMK